MKHTIFFAVLLFLFSIQSFSQAIAEKDSNSFYTMSLEQLMNINVSVASQLPSTSRESPGIITVITADEIKKTGVQDLMQVLQQVPGFDFGVDVEGVIGIGVRGNWAHEGKALLLWDGMELNEDLYATLQFVHHYPIDRVKQIEIIRGPGSARYGGSAEYAVINVITYNSTEFNGVYVGATNSWMSKTFGSRNLSMQMGKTIGEAHINFSTNLGEAIQSQEKYTDFKGSSFDMTNQSGIENSEYRMDFFVKGLSISGLYNNYSVEQRDGFDVLCNRIYTVGFNSAHISAKYDIHGKNGLIITPGIKLKYQQPWKYKDPVVNDFFKPFNTTIGKKEYYVNSSYDISNRINLESGIQYYNQRAKDLLDSGFFNNGTKEFLIDNYAVYFQSTVKLNFFNVILGSRYNFNPYYCSSFVPRVGITKVYENWHYKALYSSAFRSPSIENINIGKDIKPEKTSVIELEAGYKVSSNSYITSNIFHIKTDDPIVYGYDNKLNEYYFNDCFTGSRGFEIEYKLKYSKFYTTVNYSYYEPLASNKNEHSVYFIPGIKNQSLAFPSNKLNLTSNFAFSRTVNINFSQSYLSKRYSASENDLGIKTVTQYHPIFYSNASWNFENVFAKGFLFRLSCLNIFDEKVYYIQPYNGNHEPLPGAGREIQIHLSYSF